MLLLAVDTCGRSGSLALARATGPSAELQIVEEVPLDGGSFSAQLIPQAGALLEKYGYRKSDLSGLGVASGPGSFTGLRVGLAAVKALAEVLAIPLAAASLLEVIARNGGVAGRVFSALDAGRSELYVGDYDLGSPLSMLSERLMTRAEFSSGCKDRPVLTPYGSIAEFARSAGFRVEQVQPPGSGDIARLAWERIRRGETVTPEALEANYIRRTDAEIFSKPKS